MAITLGVHTATGYTSPGSTTTTGITTQATGSLDIVGTVSESSSAAPTITDTYSNTWTLVDSREVGSWPAWIHLYTCENAVGGPGHTITATKAAGYTTVFFAEFIGVEIASALDQVTGAANDPNNPITSGSISTTTANQLLIGFCGTVGTGVASFSFNNSFTLLDEITSFSFWQGALGYRIVSATGTYEASVDDSNFTTGAAIIASFKELVTDEAPFTPANGVATAATMPPASQPGPGVDNSAPQRQQQQEQTAIAAVEQPVGALAAGGRPPPKQPAGGARRRSLTLPQLRSKAAFRACDR
jgi:hypothetical protein